MMQLRVWLVDSEPEVWRPLVVDPRLTLEQFHKVLQHAFGWTDSHMHQYYEEDGTRYAIPSPMDHEFEMMANVMAELIGGASEPEAAEARDERKALLGDVFDRPGKTIAYEYDFGDSWIHAVQFEKMVNPEELEYPIETFVEKGKGAFSGKPRAAICLAGERSGPPEDCGEIWGFQELLELKAAPRDPGEPLDEDDLERLEWLGDWAPDAVDLSEINRSISRVRVKKAHAG